MANLWGVSHTHMSDIFNMPGSGFRGHSLVVSSLSLLASVQAGMRGGMQSEGSASARLSSSALDIESGMHSYSAGAIAWPFIGHAWCSSPAQPLP